MDCGYNGITESECLERNCCFDSSEPNVNWCFYPSELAISCTKVISSERMDCGYNGITESECLERNCCFDSSEPNVNWCFYPSKNK
nr:integumentary mucin C.1-like [Hydra vulgaris]